MLFTWWRPSMRWAIYERFFRLPENVIHRFFALDMTRLDRVRILAGKPPRGMNLRGRFPLSR
jgi:lycopene beta-cyclase